MPFSFNLTTDVRALPPQLEPTDLAGEDISLAGGDFSETPGGDLATVTGFDCAKQSINREMAANPGAFARRPTWGAGVLALMFKGATPSSQKKMISRARSRLLANPRVTKVLSVTAELNESGTGTRVDYVVNVAGGPLSSSVTIKPPGA